MHLCFFQYIQRIESRIISESTLARMWHQIGYSGKGEKIPMRIGYKE